MREKEVEDIVTKPLTAASVQAAHKAWAMSMSYSQGSRLCWWVDLAAIDVAKIKDETVPLVDSMRSFVWLAHVAMYDPLAQRNGMVFVENSMCRRRSDCSLAARQPSERFCVRTVCGSGKHGHICISYARADEALRQA